MAVAKQANQQQPQRVVKNHWAARKAAHQAGVPAGLVHGFRSGLEEQNAKWLKANGIEGGFESTKIRWVQPTTLHIYTPDFTLPNGIIIETKGKFEPADRKKHMAVKAQYPELDIRFVFQRPSDRLSAKSTTTYGAWATKAGIKWAAKLIPVEWMREAGPARRPEDVLKDGPIVPKETTR